MTSHKLFKPFFFILLSFIAISYFLLFSTYRASEVDDAWTASYVWSIVHNNSVEDTVFGMPSNVQYFGHIHAYITGIVADIFGWQKSVFHSLNLIWVFGAAIAWFLVGTKTFGNRWQAALFIVLLFALEPFLGACYKARSDALAFFLVSWALVAAIYARFFIATFVVSLAVEIHAISSIGYFWIFGVLLYNYASAKYCLKPILLQIIFAIAGGLAGFAVYKFIHPQPLAEILQYLYTSNAGAFDSFNMLTAHYFNRQYYRFIPELIFWFVGCALFFWHERRIFNVRSLGANLFWVTILTSLIITRANFHYVIFFYPPLFMLALMGYGKSRLFYPAIICLALYANILSATLFYMNRNVDHAGFDRNISAISLPNKDLSVYGPTNAWFVLREKNYYVVYDAIARHQGKRPDQIYYIKSIYTNSLPECAQSIEQIGKSFIYNEQEVSIWLYDLKFCPE